MRDRPKDRQPYRTTAGEVRQREEEDRKDATRVADSDGPDADRDPTAGRVGHRGGEHPGVPPGEGR